MDSDYLKYWRVVRYFIKAKHGLRTSDLDMLLFLKSEEYFSKEKYEEYENILSWDRNRFNNLIKNGWVEVFRKRKTKSKTIYTLTVKCKRVLNSLYKKLNGEEMPSSPSYNPMFKRNVSFSDKIYRNMIVKMNEVIKQQQHHSPK